MRYSTFDKIRKVFTYTFIIVFGIAMYIVCTPAVRSKESAIKKCKLLYEKNAEDFVAIADFLEKYELRDSAFMIHIRGSDGLVTLDILDTLGKRKGEITDKPVLPEKIFKICRKINIAEIKRLSSDNFFRLATGAFSNSKFDIDVYVLKKGEKDFNIRNKALLIENLNNKDSLNYILGPYKDVLFFSKGRNEE